MTMTAPSLPPRCAVGSAWLILGDGTCDVRQGTTSNDDATQACGRTHHQCMLVHKVGISCAGRALRRKMHNIAHK